MSEFRNIFRYSKSSIIVRDDRISPEIKFSERSRIFKFVSRAISGGVEPVMLFLNKFRASKLVRAIIWEGKNPIELRERSRLFTMVRSVICVGKNTISFPEISRLFNMVRSVICVGKNPIAFSERSRLSSLVIDDKKSHVVGNERSPKKLIPERPNDVKFAKFPKSSGIEPVQVFSERSSVAK